MQLRRFRLCLGTISLAHLLLTSAFAAQPARELLFEPNVGQAASGIEFISRTPSYTLLLKESAATLKFKDERLSLNFGNSSQNAKVIGSDRASATVNYFRGSDASLWHRGISTYRKVTYESLYPGIDIVFHAKGSLLEYDFVVHPHADPSKIELSIESKSQPSIAANGDLVISAGKGELRFQAPLLYQDSTVKPVQAKYVLEPDHTIRLAVGTYDHSKKLLIDPVVTYSTFFGGSDDEGIFGIQRDEEGNIYLSGETSSLDFPTANPVQHHEGGDYDAFVSKLDPSGTHLIYSTYLGGSGYDHAVGLAVDSRGEAYIAGETVSPNFPTKNALQSVLKGSQNAFVAHLTRSGSDLVFSTYLGGSKGDGAQDLTIDQNADIYVAGYTNSPDFPVTSAAYQTVCDGPNSFGLTYCNNDAFVTKIASTGSKLLYSTFLGGSSYDGASGIAVDRAGAAYVAGGTSSADFPVLNAFQPVLAGRGNAFITKLSPTGGTLEFSTYLGGSIGDNANAIALGPAGNIYVTGSTISLDFPLVEPFQATNRGGWSDGFVSKLSRDGRHLLRSSYFGGSGWDVPSRLAVDAFGSVSVIGFTTSTDLTVSHAIQRSFAGGFSDAFALKLLPNSWEPLYSTYLGGKGDEFGYGILSEKYGQLWIGGSTSSVDYPIRAAFQPKYAGGPFDAFLTRISLTIPDYFRILEDIFEGSLPFEQNHTMQQVVTARQHFSGGAGSQAISADLEMIDLAIKTAVESGEMDASKADRAAAVTRAIHEAIRQ